MSDIFSPAYGIFEKHKATKARTINQATVAIRIKLFLCLIISLPPGIHPI
ncbi:hypothetical protein [Methanolobus vulcani]|nr:hypothetical protein [Methanolobus vulcani]